MCLLGVLFEWFGYLFFPPPLEHFICRAKQFARDDNSPSTSPPPPVNESPAPLRAQLFIQLGQPPGCSSSSPARPELY